MKTLLAVAVDSHEYQVKIVLAMILTFVFLSVLASQVNFKNFILSRAAKLSILTFAVIPIAFMNLENWVCGVWFALIFPISTAGEDRIDFWFKISSVVMFITLSVFGGIFMFSK